MASSSRRQGPAGVVANDAKSGPKGEAMTPIPSASLVILCPISSSANDYATLMVQRKATGSFRSAVVFPGGLLDQADQYAVDNAPQKHKDEAEGYLDALRLCALRETFEETGLLLLPTGKDGDGTLSRAVGPEQAGMSADQWTAARKAVHDDAREFPSLLQRVQQQSDVGASSSSTSSSLSIASLRHHSNWVTPRTLVRPAKRFDTHFFITILDRADALGKLTSAAAAAASSQEGKQGSGAGAEASTMAAGLTADGSETTSLRLARPSDLMSLAIRDEIILFPPQYYLLSDVDTTLRRGVTAPLDIAPLHFGEQIEEAASDDPSSHTRHRPRLPGVSSVEPQGQPANGAMIPRIQLSSTGGRAGGGQAESNDEDQIFVLPLVLPGDDLRPVRGQSATADGRRNRVYCTPRSKGEGGGLMVHGAHRRNIPGLLDFQYGHIPVELDQAGADRAKL